jgi:hypothetical protein
MFFSVEGSQPNKISLSVLHKDKDPLKCWQHCTIPAKLTLIFLSPLPHHSFAISLSLKTVSQDVFCVTGFQSHRQGTLLVILLFF